MNAAQSGGHTGGGSMGKKGSQMEVIILNLKCTHIPHSYKNHPPISHSFLKQKESQKISNAYFPFHSFWVSNSFDEAQVQFALLCVFVYVCVFVCIRQYVVHRLDEPVLLFVIEFPVGRDVLRLPNDLQKN